MTRLPLSVDLCQGGNYVAIFLLFFNFLDQRDHNFPSNSGSIAGDFQTWLGLWGCSHIIIYVTLVKELNSI